MPSVHTVILTREPPDNQALASALLARGIEVVEYPCLATRVMPPDPGSLRPASQYRALAFTSRHAVVACAALLGEWSAAGLLLGAVGQGTAAALAVAAGRQADLVADPPTGECLGCLLADRLTPGDRVLHLRGTRTTGSMEGPLLAAGILVEEAVVYESVTPSLQPLQWSGHGGAVAFFASPSAAEAFLRANPALALEACVAIGSTTATWLEAHTSWKVVRAASPALPDLERVLLAACSLS